MNPLPAGVLSPRSLAGFYRGLLRGVRLWRRPPQEYCDRCAECTTVTDEVEQLTKALTTFTTGKSGGDVDLVRSAGGERKAWARVRFLQTKLPDLQKHVAWKDKSRAYVKHREQNLRWELAPGGVREVLLYLDYGGMQDSRGAKCSVWSACALAKDRLQEHFDFHFDAANQNHSVKRGDGDGHKKDGEAGIFFLGALIDPARHPGGGGRSLLDEVFQGATNVLLSGDTGNGFRAYEMLEELSKVLYRFGLTYKVELMPLGPGHAYNRTDARLARQNTFLSKLVREARVFGSVGIAAAFRAAARGGVRRKFLERSHVYHAVVPVLATRDTTRTWGTMGKGLGVRGLAYFRFYSDSDVPLPEGTCCLAREYSDPTHIGNPTRLYCFAPAALRLMCQSCSDAQVFACCIFVPLTSTC